MNSSFIGVQIKSMRNEKKIKQAELAKGICSISYLSKIENESVIPSQEIEDLLLKRLNFKKEKEDNSSNEKKIIEWYESIKSKDFKRAKEFYLELQIEKATMSKGLQILFDIILIHYYILSEDMKSARKLVNYFLKNERGLTEKSLYYLYKVLGQFYYTNEQFDKSFIYFERCLELVKAIDVLEVEIADLYYSYGLNSSRVEKTSLCLKYITMSLNIYQANYMLNRCVECHVLLGISFKRQRNSQEAMNHYNIALELAATVNYTKIINSIKHNIANLHTLSGERVKAADLYEQLLQKETLISEEEYLIVTLAHVHNLYILKRRKEAKVRLAKGRVILEKMKMQDKFIVEFDIFSNLLNGNYFYIDTKMEKEYIPSLVSLKKNEMISLFCIYLADLFYENGKYKKAATYYRRSRELSLN